MTERDIINKLQVLAGPDKNGLIKGIGDDCAVMKKDGDRLLLATMDTLVESVHFDLAWHTPEKLGRKAVAVNVSDIAAMGGTPLFIFLSLGLPQGFDNEWLDKFSSGLSGACQEYGCVLAGGDTVRSPDGITLTLAVIGEVETDRVLYRKGAEAGDEIWVSGTLGNAAAGLELCRTGRAKEAGIEGREIVEHHLNPYARLRLGRILSSSGLVHSMMDLSDGLATDLAHLCRESGTGAVIYSDLLPLSSALKNCARLLGEDYLSWMLAGGEDYELVFTVPGGHAEAIIHLGEEVNVSLTRIGRIEEKKGVRLVQKKQGVKNIREEDISFVGFDHFSPI